MTSFLKTLHTRFVELDEQFRSRTLRERALLGGGLVALLFLMIDSTLIRPVTEELERVESLTKRVKTDLTSMTAERESLAGTELSDEERRLFERRRQLERQLAEVDQQIASEISELVPPEAVVSVLEDMLDPRSGLSLVRLKSQEPHRVGSGASHESGSESLASVGGLYRHGLQLELEGDFASILDYLERVEDSPWHLLWDRFEYRVKQFPTATVIIDLHTVSEQEEWIGV